MADPAAPRRWALGLRALGLGALGWAATGCGPTAPGFDATVPLTDGVFVGESDPDGEGAFGRATVTVTDGRISASEYVTIQEDGSIKAEDYGKNNDGTIGNPARYRAAQKAVAAFDVYARQLIEVGVPADVDVISGATIGYNQFLEAATAALVASQEAQPALGLSPSAPQ
jgi:major membrane immunogen (membrane-anchored lipoprotein)